MNPQNKQKWYNVANPSIDQIGGAPESPTKGRRYIPHDKIRKWAMESKDGGRAFCEKCGHYFAMYYIRRVKLTPFRTGLVCCDCKKEHKLQEVR